MTHSLDSRADPFGSTGGPPAVSEATGFAWWGEYAGHQLWADSVPLRCCPSAPGTDTNRHGQPPPTVAHHHQLPPPTDAIASHGCYPPTANAANTSPSSLAAHLPTAASEVHLGNRHPRLPPLQTPRPTTEPNPSTLPPTADPAPCCCLCRLSRRTCRQWVGLRPRPPRSPSRSSPQQTPSPPDPSPADSAHPLGWLLMGHHAVRRKHGGHQK
ncbi:uncharacterized protein [Manis javanica]|uniref:uncharacterized protein n=1 Tax=Manis javanica TaxID=9974 RepID=UPI003C6D995F